MRKLLVLLAVVLAFAFTSAAQTNSSSMGQSKSSGMSSEKGMKSDKMGKESTVTGCLSKERDASGNYTLTNGRYKKGIAVSPAEKVKDHAGHEVRLTGMWSGTGTSKMFEVSSLKHISATCKVAGGMSMGKKDMGKGDMSK